MSENSQWLVKAQKVNGEFVVFKFAGILPTMLRLRAAFVYDLIAKTDRRGLHTDPKIKIADFAGLAIPWVNTEWLQRNGFAPGLITKEAAVERARNHSRYEVYSSLKDKAFFFVNDYCYGLNRVAGKLPERWVPCSFGLPTRVVPREGLESGIVQTIDEWIFIFERNSKLIESEEQLQAILEGGSNG